MEDPGKGRGPELYLPRRMMSDDHGEIRLEAPNGSGAAFSLLCPAALAVEEVAVPVSRSDSLALVR